jgi:hypothetical protein
MNMTSDLITEDRQIETTPFVLYLHFHHDKAVSCILCGSFVD